jgi:hypothetical protein
MKMDAMQKRRMWTVAAVHFCLSVVILAIFDKYAIIPHSFSGGFTAMLSTESWIAWQEAWRNTWGAAVFILQPQIWLLDKFSRSFYTAVPQQLILPFVFLSIPIWSICFSWLFVKLVNWLNHFPVLGKKVF